VLALTRDQESRLVAEAKANPAAFGDLYEYYLPKMYRFAYYRTGNKHEAEDVVAQTFLQAIEALPKYEERGYSLGCWLYKIAGNLIRTRQRSRSREIPRFEDVSEADWDASIELLPEQISLQQILHTLPDDQQQALVLRYVQDLSIKEVAQIMDRSEGAVKQLAFRGLQNMRERMNCLEKQ
jgi:RNA polymerase sigma-70 factor (ECF subfamily)